jgi:hypothetical protein
MTLSRTLHLTIATAVCAAAAAQAALAGGEPKNQSPFIRAAADGRVPAQVVRGTTVPTSTAILGERKNQIPFTLRLSQGPTLARILRVSHFGTEPTGEAKNELPFTRLAGAAGR